MKNLMKRFLSLVAAIIAVIVTTGCASYTAPVDLLEANISPKKMAEARHAISTIISNAKLGEEVASASASVCSRQGKRLPFLALSNPQFADRELRSAYLKAGLTENVKLFAVSSEAMAFDGKFVTKVGSEPTAMGQPDQAYLAAHKLATADKPVELSFSDGTTATVPTQQGCSGLTVVVPGTGHPTNWGMGVELVSVDWMSLAVQRDESLFVMGRSLYFSSDAGAQKLTDALYQGAALNGIATGLTLGLSRLVGDAKNGINALARSSNAKVADEFGMRAAVRAGADPARILAFVRRMNAKKDLIWEEMRFSGDRIPALEKVARELTTQNPMVQATPLAPIVGTDIAIRQ